MKEFGNIFLSWRKGSGGRRHIVGVLKSNKVEGVRFSYIKNSVAKAAIDGFSPYTEFPDVGQEYNSNVLKVFGQRLLRSERSDSHEFFDFWEVNERYKEDKYYLLAHTMGLTPTDNFEFLADYNPIRGLCFITDLAGLSHYEWDNSELRKGDTLDIALEKGNAYDNNAVQVSFEGRKVGYIKKIHNRVFHKVRESQIEVKVKAIESGRDKKRVFIRVSIH